MTLVRLGKYTRLLSEEAYAYFFSVAEEKASELYRREILCGCSRCKIEVQLFKGEMIEELAESLFHQKIESDLFKKETSNETY